MSTRYNPEVPVAQTAANTVIAYRGESKLTEESLRAHLATILRLEHIGLLLGAGASVGLRGMTIEQLWESFSQKFAASAGILVKHAFYSNGETPNLERLLDRLEIACLEAERTKQPHCNELRSAQLDLRRAVVTASILNEGFWTDSAQVHEIPPILGDHCRVLQKLRGARQPGQPAPWIFTPNYDLAVEWAAEAVGLEVMNGFRGLHHRTFSPHAFDLGLRNTLARGEARFGCYELYLAKLHGSLTWQTLENGTVIENSASAMWPQLSAFRDRGEGDFGRSMVFPSAAKYLQTVGFVLGELFRRFTEFLNRPQTGIVVNGYSFGDDHLNRIILSALQNPTLSLVVYAPMAAVSEDGLDIPDQYLALKKIAALKSPQVTIIGNDERAYFSAFAGDLPDPAILDRQSQAIRQMLKDLKEIG
jgi:hypothetical protein